ncbi:MAG: SHOCT domain-containing protein [Rhodobacteraceae bacterium]|nr:SHOCT domain-containing protein [Paracoccaceae bacterium]
MKLFNKYLPALAVLALPAQALADITGGYGSMGNGMGYGGWFFGPLMMILFFGLIIAAVVGALRLFGMGGEARSNRALDILSERYASGEIDEAEFTTRRKALKS